MTLFEINEKLATLGEALNADAEWIASKAASPETTMDELKEKEAHRDDIANRIRLLTAERDRMAEAQKAHVKAQMDETDGEKTARMKGEFYRAALLGDTEGIRKAYQGLGGIPGNDADLGYGDKLLPKNMTSDLLTEPEQTNSLREVEVVTNITGLEIPKLSFEIEDADLADVTDKDTAKEIEMEGDSVSFGRFKTKIKATVKDTVLHGAAVDLTATIEGALRSGLAVKEKMRAFATAPDTAHAHMSFYSEATGIKKCFGATLLDAILNALGDLPESFAGGAKVVMRKSDYITMIRSLVNGSDTLFGRKPEEVIGVPVAFNDYAVTPIVGNFAYAQLNYDIGTIYDTDKDVSKGEYYFVLTAWGDHQIKLKSAFRLAEIGQVPTLEGVTVGETPTVGTAVGVTLTYSSGTPTPVLSYQWKKASSASGSYSDISGATYATYTPAEGDVGKYLKCQVTATGAATGTVLSAASTAVSAAS